ncbi:YceD family protein [Methylomonas sp. SURF-2]|uniref:Large ribosomal RNA subunit accumulation protein YceD n=1 Tax=Methylomonas subterranea TaxID=2952225 RepID=A0ABT1TI78_9GAMM|nr:YceD family protein [Methylomonas sp. SURF-2]MCQ8105172.1 YceD family protein [Methylomonas sp. SURF-2]
MSDKLPNLIDPLLFAERRSILAGSLKISTLERLSGMVANTEADIEVDVRFAKQGKRAVVSGSIKTLLELECQSCLQILAWPIELSFKLAVVSSLQEADQLELDCEPLLLDGEKVSLNDLIEDEILLAIPDYPKHGYDCIARQQSKDPGFDDNSQTQTNNPFSVLAKLKKTGE